MKEFSVEPVRCSCHPETCCCYAYVITDKKGNPVARGDDLGMMNMLVNSANTGLEVVENAVRNKIKKEMRDG